MKSIFYLLIIFVSSSNFVYTQSLSERELYTSNSDEIAQVYNFVYQDRTGAFCYLETDPETFKSKIVSRYGESKAYDYASTYYIKFDEKGNYYTVTYDYVEEGSYDSLIYFFLMNGDEIQTLEYAEVYDAYVNPADQFEFVIREGENFMVATYSPERGLVKSGNYSSIRTAYKFYSSEMETDEDNYFRNDDGYRYYVVRKNDKAFLYVNGTEIETGYSDVDNSSLTYDNNGSITYIAKVNGIFWEDYGYELVVQGDRAYNQFGKVYSPVLFTPGNEPVYTAAERMEDGENFISHLVKGNEVRNAYTDASKQNKVEDFTAGIYDLFVDPNGSISYTGSVRVNWDFYDYTKVYSKSSRVVNDIAEGFYNDLGVFKRNLMGDELFTYNTTDVSGGSVLALKTSGETRVISDPKFTFISDYGFTPDNKVYYVGVIPGDYDLKIKDQNTIVIDGIEIGTYPSLIYSEQSDGVYSSLIFDEVGNYAYATFDYIDTSENYEEWYSVSYVITKNGTLTPQILPMPGRAFFNSVDRLTFVGNGKLFYVGTVNDVSNPYLSYYQLNVNNSPFNQIYNNYDSYSYDRLMNRIRFLGVKENKIYEVILEP